MSMIVGLCGYGRVGKDTANIELGFLDPYWKRFAFADALKSDVGFLPGVIGHDAPENKEVIRDLWVAYGHVARALEPGHWIARLERSIRMDEDKPEKVIVTDCRYANEVKWFMDQGGLVINITRPGFGPLNREERDSFREIKRLYPDMPVVCNDGSPTQLGGKVYKLILDFFHLKHTSDPYIQTA